MIANARKISMAGKRLFSRQTESRPLINKSVLFANTSKKEAAASGSKKDSKLSSSTLFGGESRSKLEKKEDNIATNLLFASKPKNSHSNLRHDDDIHSLRFKSLLENRSFTTEAEKKNAYVFFFNRIEEKTIPVYLDDINIINIDNEETFHRVPTLAHKLDTVV